MKKGLLVLLSAVFSVLLLSCGGDSSFTMSDKEGKREFHVTIADCSHDGMITGSTLDKIGYLSVRVMDSDGKEKLWGQSFASDQIESGMEISGIPDVVGGLLVITAYKKGDNNNPVWLGRVSNVSFKKGKTTNISVVLYPIDGSITCMPERLKIGRFGHSATRLPDGRILVAGGFVSATGEGGHTVWQATDTAEILDVETGSVELLDVHLKQPRAMHTAFALPDGSVILVGGVRKMSMLPITVSGYGSFPITYKLPVTSVERFKPPYPKYNLLMNDIGTPTGATAENIVLDDPHFYPYQSYYTVKINDSHYRVYIAGGLKNDGTSEVPVGTVSVLDVSFDAGSGAVTAVVSDFGAGDPSLLPAVSGNASSVIVAGGRPDGIAVGQKFSPQPEAWGTSMKNVIGTTLVSTDSGAYAFGGMELEKDSTADDLSFKDVTSVYEMLPGSSAERTGSLLFNTIFSDIVYLPSLHRFVIQGGALSLLHEMNDPRQQGAKLAPGQAHNIALLLDINSFKGTTEGYRLMKYDRMLSRTVVINESTLLTIGGVTGLSDSGELVPVTEVRTVR